MTNELSGLDKALLAAADRNNRNSAGEVFALLELGANINAVDARGNNAAILLAMNRNGDAVVRLAEIDTAVLDRVNWYENTAVLCLATADNLDTVIDTVIRLAEIYPAVLKQANGSGHNIAINLAMRNRGDAVVKLATIDPTMLEHATNVGNNTATFLADWNDSSAVIRLAEINPAVLYQFNDDGSAAVIKLAQHGNVDAVLRLAERHPAIKEQEGIIIAAITFKHAALIKRLLREGFALPDDIDKRIHNAGLSWQVIAAA